MDANDVKTKFFDIAPPEPRKKPTELNMQSRQVMVENPVEASETEPNIVSHEVNEPVKVHRELVIETSVRAMPVAEENTEPVKDEVKPDKLTENSAVVEPAPASVGEELIAKQEPRAEAIVSLPDVKNPETSVVEPLPENNVVQETPIATADNIEDKDTPVFGNVGVATDGLPDPGARSVSEIKDGMQEPKIYDTTAYHIPIKETVHSHGGLKAAFIFGGVFAVLVVGALVFVMYQIGT